MLLGFITLPVSNLTQHNLLLDVLKGPTYIEYMPYVNDTAGVYQIRNVRTGEYYVGATKRLRKRTKEHLRLLRLGQHPNPKLQQAFTADPDNFDAFIEIECADIDDLDWLEEEFLQGNAWFGEQGKMLNISLTAKTPMKYRKHTEGSKQRMREAHRKSSFDRGSEEYRKKLREAKERQHLSNPAFVAKLKVILENDHLSYAERGRMVGSDTSAVRKLALNYAHLKGVL